MAAFAAAMAKVSPESAVVLLREPPVLGAVALAERACRRGLFHQGSELFRTCHAAYRLSRGGGAAAGEPRRGRGRWPSRWTTWISAAFAARPSGLPASAPAIRPPLPAPFSLRARGHAPLPIADRSLRRRRSGGRGLRRAVGIGPEPRDLRCHAVAAQAAAHRRLPGQRQSAGQGHGCGHRHELGR